VPDGEGYIKQLNKRIECDDARAYYELGHSYFYGNQKCNVVQDRNRGLTFWQRAGELGSAVAFKSLANAYKKGTGVPRDEGKARHYFELAAMGGNTTARHYLGFLESVAGNNESAIKHWMIAAQNGSTRSLSNIRRYLVLWKFATKLDFEKAIRAYQQYLDDIRSEQRDEAAAFSDNYTYLTEDDKWLQELDRR
jgi:TPR repeat protein